MRKNFSWNFIGNVVYAGCQWGILVVMAKLTSPEMVGRFALGLAITAPIVLLSELQLRGVQATDAKGDFDFGHYLAVRLIMIALALAAIAGYAATGGYGRETAFVILGVGLAKGFESIADIFHGLMQRHERMDRIAQSRILKGAMSLAVMALAVSLTRDVFWGVLGMAAVGVVVLLKFDLKNATTVQVAGNPDGLKSDWRKIAPRFDYQKMRELVWLAFPLGLVMTLLSLNTNIPRYFIETHYGEASLGIFAAIAYLMQVGSQVMNALSQSAAPRLASYWASKKKKPFLRLFYSLFLVAFSLGLAGVIVASLFGSQILQFIYGVEYSERADLFIWLMTAAAFSYFTWVIGVPLTAMRIFRVQFFIASTSLIVLFFSCSSFVISHGLSGAAMAIVLSQVVSLLVGGIVLFLSIQRFDKH